jgi:large subunit ribosomal protein L18
MKVRTTAEARKRRHFRIRRKVRGTSGRPRVCVYMSNKHLYAQVVDDDSSRTLVQASTLEKDLRGKPNNRETAVEIGKRLGERACAQGIQEAVFDRGGFAYGLRMKAVADAARETGLKF